jgi:hypothetical protein
LRAFSFGVFSQGALPIVFPKKRWLGLAPVLFGFAQAAAHGLIFNRLARDRYSPDGIVLFPHVGSVRA